MPRRKEQKIVLSQLERCADVYLALKDDPIFEGFDLSTLTISVKARITHVIKNAERIVSNLEHYLAANPNCCEEFQGVKYVTKKQLAKMMRVSRSTLDKWLDNELIIPIYIRGRSTKTEVFDPHKILAQLENQK